jgi:hypothetical protein
VKDSQKERLYEWEDSWHFWNVNTLSLVECRNVVRTACSKYSVPAPKVRQHNVRSMSFCIPTMNIISLQAVAPKNFGGKNLATCLHESAHLIVWFHCKSRPQDHGPTFLGIYLWLLEEARAAPANALYASARSFGLKWVARSPAWFMST